MAEVQDVHDLDARGQTQRGPALRDPVPAVAEMDDRAHARMEASGIGRNLPNSCVHKRSPSAASGGVRRRRDAEPEAAAGLVHDFP